MRRGDSACHFSNGAGRRIVAAVALIAAVAGTALAGPTANDSSAKRDAKKALKLAKKNKKAIKNIELTPGPNGEKGDPAASAWAKIDGGGRTILGQKGVAGLDGSGALYNLTFDESIVGCAWLATLNDNDTGLPPKGEIAILKEDSINTKRLQVRTFNSAGGLAPLGGGDGFSVAVLC